MPNCRGVRINGGWNCLENLINRGSELVGGWNCLEALINGFRLDGGLDLYSHVNKWILNRTLSWYAFSI